MAHKKTFKQPTIPNIKCFQILHPLVTTGLKTNKVPRNGFLQGNFSLYKRVVHATLVFVLLSFTNPIISGDL